MGNYSERIVLYLSEVLVRPWGATTFLNFFEMNQGKVQNAHDRKMQIMSEEVTAYVDSFFQYSDVAYMRNILVEMAMHDQQANPESYEPETGRMNEILELNAFLGLLEKVNNKVMLRLQQEGYTIEV